ncbi:methyl-accepting chemotaxis protein [Ornithinibacillus xuwenensis]|uniref:Methyl-accepting chemotaxis protein n=1 Tax=Ornithinibacillus xuwenensis TaxID=3144668 RepID=A0ABU9XM07_9BACI
MLQNWKWTNLRIGGKYAVVFSIMAIIFLATISLTLYLLFQTNTTMDETSATNEIAISSSELVSYFNEKYIQIPDYLVEEDEEKLQQYLTSSKQFVETAKSLKLKLENQEQLDLFNQIIANNNELDEYFFSMVVPQVQEINTQQYTELQAATNKLKENTKELGEQLKNAATKSNQLAINDAHSTINNTTKLLFITGILAIVISFILLIIISRKISKNLNLIVNRSNQIASGDLNLNELTYQGNDEIGQLSKSINDMGGSLREMIREITNLSVEVDQQSNIMSSTTDEVKLGSHQIASTVDELATGTSNQANEAAIISESTNEFSSKLQEATKHSQALVEVSNGVQNASTKGNQQMQQSLEQMKRIHEVVEISVTNVKSLEKKTNSITEIVSVIKSIAEQTNLLALNASIEAARAGEAGRGFAIVAEEVRKLSEEVANSVANISDIIFSIKEDTVEMSSQLTKGYQETDKGTEEMQITNEYFTDIKDQVEDMSQRIQKIASTFAYFEKSSQEINTSVEHIAAISEESAAGTEEIAASIQEQSSSMDNISSSAGELSRMVDNMNQLLKKFRI